MTTTGGLPPTFAQLLEQWSGEAERGPVPYP